jgi:protein O-mannosyl-transferase
MNVGRTTLVGLGLVIFAGALWLHWPSTGGEFLRVDDVEYLRQSVRWNGLTWNAAKWALTDTESYYQPLPRLSHILDYQIWGTNPMGHHATSVILHALNAALVFGLLWTLLGSTSLTIGERLMVAWWVATVFAIHPLQVESVAWVAGRTQLLCTTFGIASLWAYVAGARRWVVCLLFIPAVLSKPMAVSLPFVMLVVDYFPLRRHEHSGWGRLVREKAVLIALAVAAAAVTVIARSVQADSVLSSVVIPFSARILRMFQSLSFYASKLCWPTHLSPVYPGDVPLGWGAAVVSVLAVTVITAVALIERRRIPMLVAAWGAYAVLVLPISGLVPTGVSVSIRYAYVAMLPLLVLEGGVAVWLWRRSTKVICVALTCLLAGQLCAFAIRTRSLIPGWHDDEALRRAELAEFPDSADANGALARELLDRGRTGEALPFAQQAVALGPQAWEAHMRLGLVLIGVGQFQGAAGQFEQALRLNAQSAGARFGLGVAWSELGNPEGAIRQYEIALLLNPELAEAHNNLGTILSARGRTKDALAHYAEAVRISPDFALAHNNLGVSLVAVGRLQDAIAHYEEALRIDPNLAMAHKNLADALLQQGKALDAVDQYKQALRLRPDFTAARSALTRLGASP